MPETENTDHGMPLLLSFETARQQLGGVSAPPFV
jgi:hypothetical protein